VKLFLITSHPLHYINSSTFYDYFNHSDLIITLYGDAKDKCPTIPKGIEHIHWDLQNPAQATGSEERILSEFRKTRDIIKTKVSELNKKYSYTKYPVVLTKAIGFFR